jgi:hypothetical protein
LVDSSALLRCNSSHQSEGERSSSVCASRLRGWGEQHRAVTGQRRSGERVGVRVVTGDHDMADA